MLFTVRGDSGGDPGSRFPLARDPDTGDTAYIWVRRITQPIAEEVDRRYPGKTKRLKNGATYRKRNDADEKAALYDRVGWAITKFENVSFACGDDHAARLFSEALQREVKPGEPITFDGPAPDAAKKLLFEYVPVVLSKAIEALEKLNESFDVEETEATENLALGSSGGPSPDTPA